jgi:glycosyltransferase involved in cell wall biosynthesis
MFLALPPVACFTITLSRSSSKDDLQALRNSVRLLHVVHSCNPLAGGVAEAVNRLAEAAIEVDYEAEIATCDQSSASFLAELDVKARGFGPASESSYHSCPSLGAWLMENAASFDGLVSHGLWQYPSVAVRKAARKADKPYFVYPHGMLDPWFKSQYPWKHLKKTFFWWFRQARILRDARAVCFTTDEERRLGRGTFRPYKCNEVVTGLGVAEPPLDADAQTHAFNEKFPCLRNKRTLLFLGRIHRKKGIDLLLQAFEELSTADDHLVVAGPSEDGSFAEELARASGKFADRITWAGMIRDDLKWGALRVADALILPSHQENFGMVVAEALAVGTPVLITDKVNLWREVEDDRAGKISTADLSGIRSLMREWKNPSFYKLTPNARPCFEKRFRINTAARNLAALVEGN